MDTEASTSSGENSKRVVALKKDRLKYQNEENVWQLLHVAHVDCPCKRSFNKSCVLNKWAVVLVSNKRRQCPLWHHRETDEDEDDGLVVWDYHVFACTRWHVYDYDSTLPWPCNSVLYVEKTFRYQRLNPLYCQLLHVVDAKDYYNKFTSDRRHMLNDKGNFLHMPPPWPLINDPVLTDSTCARRTIDDMNLVYSLVSATDGRALTELQTLLYIDDDDRYAVIANVRSVTASPTDLVAVIERVAFE